MPKATRDAFRKDRVSGLLVGLYSGSIFPFVAIIARGQLHASELMISLMVAAPFIGNLFSLFWARSMEGRPKMPFVVWPTTIGRVLFILMIFRATPLTFALIVSASHILSTISSPAYAAIIKAIYPNDSRGRLMAYVKVVIMAAMMLSTFVAGKLLEGASYRYVFSISALFGVASSLVFSTINADPPGQNSPLPPTRQFLIDTIGILKQDLGFRWFALSVFVFGFANILLAPIYPIFEVDRLHVTTLQAAILANIASVIWMVMYLYWGHYVDNNNPLSGVVICVFLSSLIPINYFFAQSIWMLIPAYAVAGVVNAGIELSYFNAILHFAPEERVSQYQALFQSLLAVGGAVAPFIGSALMASFKSIGWDYKYIFLIAVIGMWAGGGMQLFGVRGRYTGIKDE